MNGTITKRPRSDGKTSWGYSFFAGRDESGKRIQVTKSGFATKREASDALRAAIAKHQAGDKLAETPALTLAEFLQTWLNDDASRNAPKTYERYREMLEAYVVPRIGAVKLCELRTLDLQRMYNQLLDAGGKGGRPLAPKTVRNIASTVHVALEHARKIWKVIETNPASDCDLPEVKRGKVKTLETDQVKAFLESVRGTWLYAFLLLDSATGCRRGELLALTWPDVDLQSGRIQITKSLEQTKAGLRIKPTKSEEPRDFVVPELAIGELARHLAEQKRIREMFGADYRTDLDLVFCGPDGDYLKPDSVTSKVCLLAQKAGLKGFSLHSLRHTHCSVLLSRGVPVTQVAARLGHKSPAVTLAIYSHALKADDQATARTFNDVLAEVISNGNEPATALRRRARTSA
jgi:integrase